jgi:hypothetical protein
MRNNLRAALVWLSMSVTLFATRQVVAGPLPLDQVMAWLSDAEARLAVAQQMITGLEYRAEVLTAVVGKMETAARNNPRNGRTAVELKEVRDALAKVRRTLAAAYLERTSVLRELDTIRVHIQAWKEMGEFAGDTAGGGGV